ncbi:MAG: hypothetical protein ACOY7L_08140 [Pseudomonadota bacterium]
MSQIGPCPATLFHVTVMLLREHPLRVQFLLGSFARLLLLRQKSVFACFRKVMGLQDRLGIMTPYDHGAAPQDETERRQQDVEIELHRLASHGNCNAQAHAHRREPGQVCQRTREVAQRTDCGGRYADRDGHVVQRRDPREQEPCDNGGPAYPGNQSDSGQGGVKAGQAFLDAVGLVREQLQLEKNRNIRNHGQEACETTKQDHVESRRVPGDKGKQRAGDEDRGDHRQQGGAGPQHLTPRKFIANLFRDELTMLHVRPNTLEMNGHFPVDLTQD